MLDLSKRNFIFEHRKRLKINWIRSIKDFYLNQFGFLLIKLILNDFVNKRCILLMKMINLKSINFH
jgi:hypothetical protein